MRGSVFILILAAALGGAEPVRAVDTAVPIPRSTAEVPPLAVPALIVTHASSVFDRTGSISPGVDAVVARFKKAGLPVVYLMNEEQGDASWIPADRSPTYAISSRSGEHALRIDTPVITVAGGWMELCQAETVLMAARSWFRRHPESRRFRVNYPSRATYTERYAYRDPENVSAPIEAVTSIGRDLTPAEAIAALGSAHRFARALETNLQYLAEHHRIRVFVDGKHHASFGAKNATVLEMHFDGG